MAKRYSGAFTMEPATGLNKDDLLAAVLSTVNSLTIVDKGDAAWLGTSGYVSVWVDFWALNENEAHETMRQAAREAARSCRSYPEAAVGLKGYAEKKRVELTD